MATTLLRPDQTFYPSPRLAAKAPVETLAYMVTFDPTRKKPDGLVTLDVDPQSAGFGKQVGRVPLRRPSSSRATLPAGSRIALVTHLHLRRQAKSQTTEARAHDRGERD